MSGLVHSPALFEPERPCDNRARLAVRHHDERWCLGSLNVGRERAAGPRSCGPPEQVRNTLNTGTGRTTDQVAYWNDEAGPRWVRMQERLDGAFAPLTEELLRRAAAQRGEIVLDIGCGCGSTVLQLASRVGPSGRVVGADVSQPMLSVAERRAGAQGIDNARLVLADVSTYDFTESSFDLAVSQFGVMFFDDPTKAFRNVRRALRPGARMLFMCWRSLSDSEFFSVPLAAAQTKLPPIPPPDATAPGPLAFADADRVRHILTDAAFTDVTIDAFDALLPIGRRADATDMLMQVGPLTRLLVNAGTDIRDAVAAALDGALRDHESSGAVALRGGVWLVGARRGAQ